MFAYDEYIMQHCKLPDLKVGILGAHTIAEPRPEKLQQLSLIHDGLEIRYSPRNSQTFYYNKNSTN